MVNVVAAISATRSDLRRVGTASQQHQPLAPRAGLPGFAGQYRDNETGYTYLRNRYYDHGTTQFTTPNPLAVAGADPYGYAASNPVNLISPNGVAVSGGRSSGGGYPGLGTPPSLAPSSRVVWDRTIGPVISTANGACFENWTDAAVCAAVGAAAVAIGAGGAVLFGDFGSIVLANGTASTYASWVGLALQSGLTVSACQDGLDSRCGFNLGLTVLGAGSLRAGALATQTWLSGQWELARCPQALSWITTVYASIAGLFEPDPSKRREQDDC